MRISTGSFLGTALILGTFALAGCDDEDSSRHGEKHETHAVAHPDSSVTTGPGWIAAGTQRVSTWRFVRQQPAPLANSHLVTTNSEAPAPQPADADDPLTGIRTAIGGNMLPSRDSIRATDLVNRALQSADTPPAGEAPPLRPTAILVTTPWNDDTLLLWIAVPGSLMAEGTAVKVEFDPKAVATFRALGDPSDLPASGAGLRDAPAYGRHALRAVADAEQCVERRGDS